MKLKTKLIISFLSVCSVTALSFSNNHNVFNDEIAFNDSKIDIDQQAIVKVINTKIHYSKIIDKHFYIFTDQGRLRINSTSTEQNETIYNKISKGNYCVADVEKDSELNNGNWSASRVSCYDIAKLQQKMIDNLKTSS